MKPNTKLRKAVAESIKLLPAISEYQTKLAIKQALPHYAKHDLKGYYHCIDCGKVWKGEKGKDPDNVTCPHCKAKLKVERSKNRTFTENNYFAIVTTCNGFQVVRNFLIQGNYRKGQAATYWIGEAFQRWISEKGTNVIVSRKRLWFGWYADRWNWRSDLEVRNANEAHRIDPCTIIGQIKTLPILKRNGYVGKDIRHLSPSTTINGVLKDNRIETMLKAKQYDMVNYFGDTWKLNKHWPSIKIAIRHNYYVSDPSIWCDMLNAMEELGKDIRNPTLICPNDLKLEHDRYVKMLMSHRDKERRERERQRALDDAKRAVQNEDKYKKAKEKFFDLLFKDGEMTVKPLVSVREFLDEGNLMHHCVFTNKYYEKDDVLVLHAIIDGVSVATIEVSLTNLRIVQCRGKYNQKPEQYDRIVKLIESNIGKIAAKHAA